MPIHTVLGPIGASELGRTSMHEHVLSDARVWLTPPRETPPADTRVSIENLGFIRWNCQSSEDNLVLDDADLAVDELTAVAEHQGSAIVDLTVVGLGRRMADLPDVARRAGVHVVVGCGYYIHASHPDWVEKASIDEICERLLDELADGIDGTGILPGLIGEIGTSAEMTGCELAVLRAAGRAGTESGSAVNVHLDPAGTEALRIVEALIDEGMSPDRIILSHMDESPDHAYHDAVAETGANLEYDTFGAEAYVADDATYTTDIDRCAHLVRMIDAGYAAQLVLGCDVWIKSMLRRFGGMGYEHLFKRIVPLLERRYGLGREVLDEILIGNPRRLLDRPAWQR